MTIVCPVMNEPRGRGEEHGGTGDLVGLADAPQRIDAHRLLVDLGIFPQRFREIGAHEAWSDAVGANVLRAPLHAMLRASAMSAAFEIPYTPITGVPSSPAIDEMMTIEPPPRSAICGSTMLHNQKLLRTLLFMTLSNASSDMSIAGPKYGLTAALQTSDIDAAPLLDRGIRPGPAALPCDRCCRRARTPRRPCARIACDDFLAGIELATGHHDLRAVLGEPLGDRAADSAARAGDDGDLPVRSNNEADMTIPTLRTGTRALQGRQKAP